MEVVVACNEHRLILRQKQCFLCLYLCLWNEACSLIIIWKHLNHSSSLEWKKENKTVFLLRYIMVWVVVFDNNVWSYVWNYVWNGILRLFSLLLLIFFQIHLSIILTLTLFSFKRITWVLITIRTCFCLRRISTSVLKSNQTWNLRNLSMRRKSKWSVIWASIVSFLVHLVFRCQMPSSLFLSVSVLRLGCCLTLWYIIYIW